MTAQPSRRHVLGYIAAGAMMTIGPACARELWQTGLQLYTVRDLLKVDFEGTLRRVAELGYREVEFAGILGSDVSRTRKLLDRFGLTAPSVHLDYASLRDNARRSFEIAQLLGSRFVVCPWLAPSIRQTSDDWRRICDDLNKIGELASRSDLTLAYHNHDFEFADLPGGIRPFDLLLSSTDERSVRFELDVYWATKGNLDSARVLRANPSRFPLLHLKDMAEDGSTTELGHGTIDFASILAAASESDVRHLFVEQDVSSDPLRSIEASITFLKNQPYMSSGSIRPRPP